MPCKLKGASGIIQKCYRRSRGSSLSHLSAAALEKYILGRSTKTHMIKAEEHLILCSFCRDRLEATDAFVQALKDAASEEPLTAGSSAA